MKKPNRKLKPFAVTFGHPPDPTKPNDARARLFAKGRLKRGERNKTEAAYEQHLEMLKRAGEILWYAFEGIKFRLADKTFYTPDFAVMNADGEIEIKEIKGSMAIFQDDAKVKIKVAAEMYPFRFFVVVPKLKRDGGGWEVNHVGG